MLKKGTLPSAKWTPTIDSHVYFHHPLWGSCKGLEEYPPLGLESASVPDSLTEGSTEKQMHHSHEQLFADSCVDKAVEIH